MCIVNVICSITFSVYVMIAGHTLGCIVHVGMQHEGKVHVICSYFKFTDINCKLYTKSIRCQGLIEHLKE